MHNYLYDSQTFKRLSYDHSFNLFSHFRDNNVKNVIGMEIESLSCRGMLDARLCDKVCQ